MTEADQAYIAGFFDGEGSIGFYYLQGKYGKLLVRITQKDRHILDWIRDKTGLGTIHEKNDGKGHMGHDWIVAHEAARKFLKMIRPYLQVKGETADRKLALDSALVKRQKRFSLES